MRKAFACALALATLALAGCNLDLQVIWEKKMTVTDVVYTNRGIGATTEVRVLDPEGKEGSFLFTGFHPELSQTKVIDVAYGYSKTNDYYHYRICVKDIEKPMCVYK